MNMFNFSNAFKHLWLWLTLAMALPAAAYAQPTLTDTSLGLGLNQRALVSWGNGDTLIMGGNNYLLERVHPDSNFAVTNFQISSGSQKIIQNLATTVNTAGQRRIWALENLPGMSTDMVVYAGNSITNTPASNTASFSTFGNVRGMAAVEDSVLVVRNSSVLWVYAYDGTSLTRTTYDVQPTPATFPQYQDVGINPSSDVIIAGANGGTVARSIDGGTTWSFNTLLAGSGSVNIHTVDYVGNQTWFVAAENIIYRSTNDGATWVNVYEFTLDPMFPNIIEKVDFTSSNIGFMVIQDAFGDSDISFTDDGALNWTSIYAPASSNLGFRDFQAVDQSIVYGLFSGSLLVEPGSSCNQSFTTDLPSTLDICLNGGNSTLEVVSTGTNLTYQWFFNGQQIMGATANTFDLSPIAPADAGDYYVEVNGDCGTTTSNTVTVDVINQPTVSFQFSALDACVADNPELTPITAGTVDSYTWTKDGQSLGNSSSFIAFAPGTGVTKADSGLYRVQVENQCGFDFAEIELRVVGVPDLQIAANQSIDACEDQVVILVTDPAENGYLFEWRKDGVTLAGQMFPFYAIPVYSNSDAGTYTVVASNNCGQNSAGFIVSTVSSEISVSNLSNDQTVAAGTDATISFVVDNSINNFPLTYQWFKGSLASGNMVMLSDDAKYSGTTTTELTITDVQQADSGIYVCSIDGSNCSGTITTGEVRIDVDTTVSRSDFTPSDFQLFPNPTTGLLELSTAYNGVIQVRVLGLTGQTFYRRTLTDEDRWLDLSELSQGMYFVELTTERGRHSLRISKQ